MLGKEGLGGWGFIQSPVFLLASALVEEGKVGGKVNALACFVTDC